MASDVFGIVGTTVAGAFEVEKVVAEGGFAVVYRAQHAGFKAPVALKCLKIPQYFTPDEQQAFREQFQAEAELLFKLSASIPTVVRPLHVEAVLAPDGTFMPFLALEWLDGETLDRYVRRRLAAGSPPPDIEEVTELLTPVARALERAHRFAGPSGPVSIVHRDMKPENIFVAHIGEEEVVKILDFGIAKAKSMASQVAGRQSRRETEGESFSPAYAAPEQWAPKRYGQTGPWTDVWGLALTIVEVLAGRPVIDGDHAAMMGTTLDERRRPTPRSEGVVVSDAVEAVFERAMALDPRERYPDAGAFWKELRGALGFESEVPNARASGTYRAPMGSGHGVGGLTAIASGRLGAGASSPDRASGSGFDMVPDLDVGPSGEPLAPSGPVPASGPRDAPLGLPSADRREGNGSVDLHGGAALELDLDDDPPRLSGAERLSDAEASSGEIDRFTSSPSSGRVSYEGDRLSARASRTPLPNGRPSSPTIGPDDPPAVRPAFIVEEPPSALQKLIWPGVMVVLGVIITIGGSAYAASTGEVWTLGPLRPTWIAALLVLGGIGWAGYRLLAEAD